MYYPFIAANIEETVIHALAFYYAVFFSHSTVLLKINPKIVQFSHIGNTVLVNYHAAEDPVASWCS